MMDEKEAFKYALRLLNRRDYTSFEMMEKLRDRGCIGNVVDSVLKKLKEKKFLDDERFCENYVFFRLKKGYGKHRISYELRMKGMEDSVINRHLSCIDDRNTAREVFLKKIKLLAGKKNCRKKLYDFMVRRGFDSETINELFAEYGRECL